MDVNIFFCFFFDFVSIYFGGGEIYILIFFFFKFSTEWSLCLNEECILNPLFFFGWIALG